MSRNAQDRSPQQGLYSAQNVHPAVVEKNLLMPCLIEALVGWGPWKPSGFLPAGLVQVQRRCVTSPKWTVQNCHASLNSSLALISLSWTRTWGKKRDATPK